MKVDIDKVAVGAAIAIGAIAIVHFVFSVDVGALDGNLWTWLRASTDGSLESNSTTLRNLSLTLGGPLAVAALYLAWRRTKTATTQTNTQIRQAGVQIRQSETAEKTYLESRYQSAIRLLQEKSRISQLSGVSTLSHLALNHHEEYYDVVRDFFSGALSYSLTHECTPCWRLNDGSVKGDLLGDVNDRILSFLLPRRASHPPQHVDNLVGKTVDIWNAAIPLDALSLSSAQSIRFCNCVFYGDHTVLPNLTNLKFITCSFRGMKFLDAKFPDDDDKVVFETCNFQDSFFFFSDKLNIIENFFSNCMNDHDEFITPNVRKIDSDNIEDEFGEYFAQIFMTSASGEWISADADNTFVYGTMPISKSEGGNA